MPEITGSSSLTGQRKDLASVAVGDKAADAVMAGKPPRKPAQLRLVNGELLVERALHCRKDACVSNAHDRRLMFGGRFFGLLW
jgi:hypothetical protein